ncbi:extracellular solute-binding protein [Pseudonocardia zijingensis]|jgi:iron(III) transport system substrate-binding protein|uniref:Extracellular solute-binding protein n=1 Tax=Pseudonocardia zijingensis TaxID=153376 RepID=A0ABP3YM26_9PSEU
MAASPRGRLLLLIAVPVAVVALVVALAVAVLDGGSDAGTADAAPPAPETGPAEVSTDGIRYAETLVVYNGRSHYGDEQVFRDFEAATGVRLELRGGTGPELFERLRREGADTPADVLVTTDLANLWRAEEAGLLQGVTSEGLRAQVPDGLHDVDGTWWAVSTRLRVPVVSTERVPAGAVTSYESLADPRFRGRTCLRTSNNEYNQSLVADMIVKRGPEATEQLLRSWMANEPQIINSDGEMLAMIAGGECDVGLANHYYLGRTLKENPAFPVAPAWPDQQAAGAHANVSGVGVVAGSDAVPTAVALMEWLTSPPAQEQIIAGSEFAANPAVAPPAHIGDWANVKIDPIDGQQAGPALQQAVEMMLRVGWT